jgi:hypothetical protein
LSEIFTSEKMRAFNCVLRLLYVKQQLGKSTALSERSAYRKGERIQTVAYAVHTRTENTHAGERLFP